MKQEDFNEIFRTRTKKLALNIISVVSLMKYDDASNIIKKQLIRSSTSVAANFRAVCRGRSDRERFAKLCIVVEEADESVLWIEMLEEAGFLSAAKIHDIKKEMEEIVKVMAAFKKKLSGI